VAHLRRGVFCTQKDAVFATSDTMGRLRNRSIESLQTRESICTNCRQNARCSPQPKSARSPGKSEDKEKRISMGKGVMFSITPSGTERMTAFVERVA